MNAAKSIATGAPLDAETWADFVQRLRHDCEGDGVRDHCTADAIFIVQARRYTYGVDVDYGGERVACVEESVYTTPREFYEKEADEAIRESLDGQAKEAGSVNFFDLSEWSQWQMIDELQGVNVLGRAERWSYVCAHFTKDAADAFIKRKAHDYREGLRVYVEAQSYSWEYNTIKAGILGGRLVFAEPVAQPEQQAVDAADLASLAEQFKGRADDCGRLARAVLDVKPEQPTPDTTELCKTLMQIARNDGPPSWSQRFALGQAIGMLSPKKGGV